MADSRVAPRFALLVAVSVGSALAHVATTGMPFQIGALIDGSGLSPSQAGLFAFCQLGGLAGSMILVSALVKRVLPTLFAVAGALLAAGAGLALFAIDGFYRQLAFGAAAGFGFGLVFTAAIAGAAICKDADRVYAIALGVALVLVTGILAALPLAAVRFGPMSIFLVLSVLALAATPAFFGFTAHAGPAEKLGAAWRIPGATGFLFSWVAFSMGTSMSYVFAERIGNSIHLTPLDIGFILSSGVIVGVAGTGVAALVANLVDRRVALATGLAGSALSCVVIGSATTYVMFAAGIFLFWIFTMFLYCFLLGSAATLDASGRLGSLGSGMDRMGYAVGAWIAGIVAEHGSYPALGMLACGICLCGLALGYPSFFRALRLSELRQRDYAAEEPSR